MDQLDKKILNILQRNANMPVADIARAVGLSTTPCWRRIQKMEDEGIIERRVVVLNQDAINLKTTVFLSIRVTSHNPEWIKEFNNVVENMPEIVECYRVSGNVDYVLRVMIPNITYYDSFYKELISRINIHSISTYFVTDKVKLTNELPLDYLTLSGQHRTSAQNATKAQALSKKAAKESEPTSLSGARTEPLELA